MFSRLVCQSSWEACAVSRARPLQVRARFLDTLTKIRKRDPVIKDAGKEFFTDADFKREKKAKEEKAVR